MRGILVQIALFVVVWRFADVTWALAATLGALSLRLAMTITGLQAENQELRYRMREADLADEFAAGSHVDMMSDHDAEPASGFRPIDGARDAGLQEATPGLEHTALASSPRR